MVKLVFKTFDVVPRFIYYYMKKEENKLKKTVKGSTIPHVNGDSLLNLYILLPPVPEQQKIAEILSTADETIRKVNEEITLTKKLKKGLMQTLLTKGIGHTKFKITEIGEIPEEWPLRPFSEVLQIRKRKNEGKSEKIYTIPMELIPQNETYCGYRSLNKSEVVPPTYCECGDILLPKITPSVENGKQGIVPTMPSGNAFATSEVYALFTNGSLTNIYTFYLLKLSLFRKPLIDSMVGTTGRQRVPKDSLFNLSFPVPPIPEQQKISEILTTIDHKLELLRSKKTHLEELKKGMMEELLTGRVRVKI
jgi:type I restriction enzyme S subunit